MAATTIEWTDHSINPIRARHPETGRVGHYCEKVSAGCTNCYASRLQHRLRTPEFGSGQKRGEYELFLDPDRLREVRRRRKPTRYFWCDMTDLFGEWVERQWINAIFGAIDATPWHTHMLLTKRPERIRRMWPARYAPDPDHSRTFSVYRPNVWLGCSIEDQQTANARMPVLASLHDLAPVRFASVEPLLGPVDLTQIEGSCSEFPPRNLCRQLEWCIVGGESGPGARPCEVSWIEDIVHQCQCAEVPCFVKQDSSLRPGRQGRIPNHLWLKQFPRSSTHQLIH